MFQQLWTSKQKLAFTPKMPSFFLSDCLTYNDKSQEMYQYVQIPYVSPPPTAQSEAPMPNLQWFWAPRTGRINWGLMESIDVDEITRKGDIGAVEFYLQSLVKANITSEDATHFGSKGAINLFMLMQLGLDYLLTQVRNYSLNTAIEKQNDYQQTAAQLYSQYEQTLQYAYQQINERDATIARLRQNIQQLNEDNENAQKLIKKMKRRIAHEKQLQTFDEREARRRQTPREPGLIDLGTDYHDIDKLQKAARMQSHGITLMPRTERTDLSDGEIDMSTFTQKTGTRTKSSHDNDSF